MRGRKRAKKMRLTPILNDSFLTQIVPSYFFSVTKKPREYKNKERNFIEVPLYCAVRTRFELVTSCVTGRHSNQLN